MPKKDGDEHIISESGNWNVADQYTKSKIMRPLNLCDYYEDIAVFGYETIADELINYQSPPNDLIRIKAFKRLINEMIRLIDNCKFALKSGNTRQQALDLKQSLHKIDEAIPRVIKTNSNRSSNTSTISISNHAGFTKLLDMTISIKSKINEPLNKNHLIFTDKEEFDPKAFKQNLKDRMINNG